MAAGTGVDAGEAAVWSGVREKAIWDLYIKCRTGAQEFYQTIGKIIYAVKRKSALLLVAIQELGLSTVRSKYAAGSTHSGT